MRNQNLIGDGRDEQLPNISFKVVSIGSKSAWEQLASSIHDPLKDAGQVGSEAGPTGR